MRCLGHCADWNPSLCRIKEFGIRRQKRLKAIKLVLKFKTDMHAQREARVASVMTRVVSLIPEMMLEVIKASIRSQIGGYWNVQPTTILASVADQLFIWPDGLTDSKRKTLQLELENALIKAMIVKITMNFTPQDTINVPPLLMGKQNDLRRLALDLHATPAEDTYNRGLNKGVKTIPSLEAEFPNVEVFVLSLYLHCQANSGTRRLQRFKKEVLRMRNLKRAADGSGWKLVTVEESVIAVVAAFAQLAPKKRKLIRFGSVLDECDGYSVGPLVEVNSPGTQAFEQAVASNIDEENTGEEDQVFTYAERIFDQAYHAPRVERRRQF
jgi:hypothetical protein